MKPLLLALPLLAACSQPAPAASPTEPSPPAPAPAPAAPAAEEPSASAVLADLRARLGRVRAAEPDAHVVEGPVEAAALVGAHRGVVERALGEPARCDADQAPAPCEQPADVFYSFYHLPDGWVGGGPELLLRYDAAGSCTQAVWRFTQ